MTDEIEFRSDNAAGVAPEILKAVEGANRGTALAYGADAWTERMTAAVAEVFENPDVSVFPVSTGTAANSLALAAMCPSWGSILCHETAHILNSECGATSMVSGGAVMRGLPGIGSKLTVGSVADAFSTTRWGDPHHSQPRVLSFTSPTDQGEVYTIAELTAVVGAARDRNLRVHLDGARVANAIAALACSPAEYTWRAGIDVVSLGATKNGALSTDAIVCFDPALAEELTYRTKRAGHVASKMRFQSVQIETYLRDGLWLRLAGRANAAMRRLAAGLDRVGLRVETPPAANMLFVTVGDDLADRLESVGLRFYRTGPGVIRLVTSFETSDADIDDALERIGSVLAAPTG